jgi:hypothetical protein
MTSGNHESVNQAGEIVEIRIAKIVQQEHAVRRNGAKENARYKEIATNC